MVTTAALAGFGVAQPSPVLNQSDLWDEFFARHFGGSDVVARIYRNVGVTTRCAVVNPLVEDISRATTGVRMRRYATEAPALGRAAVADALTDAGLAPDEIGLFTVASCTGYMTPGLDILVAAQLGMAEDTRRLSIGHMGCYAALPGLAATAEYVVCHQRPAVLLCCELPSLHLQPPTRQIPQVVAHALFSDAAAAVVLRPDDGGSAGAVAPADGRASAPALVDVTVRTDPATSGHMTWDVTDHGFRMGLSPRVADALAGNVAAAVGKLLARHGLTPSEVGAWAVHPGGPRILDVVESELGLPPEALSTSRAVLRDHGNCSSATVLMVLAAMRRDALLRPGDHVVAMAFGPGLTLYAALLRC